MMNNTVYFNHQWMEALACLNPESRNRIIGAIITYQVTGEMPELTEEMATFLLMKIEVDRRNRRLADAREKRSAKKAQKNPLGENVEAAAVRNEPAPSPSVEKNPPKPSPSSGQNAPESSGAKPPRPEISPEKKAAIASLIASLQQPRSPSAGNGKTTRR